MAFLALAMLASVALVVAAAIFWNHTRFYWLLSPGTFLAVAVAIILFVTAGVIETVWLQWVLWVFLTILACAAVVQALVTTYWRVRRSARAWDVDLSRTLSTSSSAPASTMMGRRVEAASTGLSVEAMVEIASHPNADQRSLSLIAERINSHPGPEFAPVLLALNTNPNLPNHITITGGSQND